MTVSELSVALLVAEGLTDREVAERLFVSPHTVEQPPSQHLSKARNQLTSRAGATRRRKRITRPEAEPTPTNGSTV